MNRPIRTYSWYDGRTLTLGKKTQIMGIMNVSPEYLSYGGNKWNTIDKALYHTAEMAREGADIIDLGVESPNPIGGIPISAEREIARLIPILEHLIQEVPVPIAIDTYKFETAMLALELGVHILNDVFGLQYDREPGKMAQVAADYNVPIILVHNQQGSEYGEDLIWDISRYFAKSVEIAHKAGVDRDKIILDPGFDFGKTPAQSLMILSRLEQLTTLPYPMMIGPSHKPFLQKILDLPQDDITEGIGAACVIGIMKGADIVRVHDIKKISQMARITDAITMKGL